MTYSEKLKDPRWQKKRLDVLQRDDWTCQTCFDKETTLHVHHFYYKRGKDPWEYPGDALVTICEKCHQISHSYLNDLEREIWDFVRDCFGQDSYVRSIRDIIFKHKAVEQKGHRHG